MLRTVLATSLLALLAGSLGAQNPQPPIAPPPGPPPGPPPRIALVRLDAEGRLVMPVTVPVTRMEQRQVVITRNGRQQVITQNVPVTTYQQVTRIYDAKTIQVADTTGKKIEANQLPTLLGQQRAVLVSSTGARIDPAYLDLIKEGALVLVLPEPATVTPPVRPPIQPGPPVIRPPQTVPPQPPAPPAPPVPPSPR